MGHYSNKQRNAKSTMPLIIDLLRNHTLRKRVGANRDTGLMATESDTRVVFEGPSWVD